MGSQNAHDHIIPVDHTTTRPNHVNLCPLHHPAVVVEAVTLLTPVAEGRGGLAEHTRPHHPWRPHDHITSHRTHTTTSSLRQTTTSFLRDADNTMSIYQLHKGMAIYSSHLQSSGKMTPFNIIYQTMIVSIPL